MVGLGVAPAVSSTISYFDFLSVPYNIKCETYVLTAVRTAWSAIFMSKRYLVLRFSWAYTVLDCSVRYMTAVLWSTPGTWYTKRSLLLFPHPTLILRTLFLMYLPGIDLLSVWRLHYLVLYTAAVRQAENTQRAQSEFL